MNQKASFMSQKGLAWIIFVPFMALTVYAVSQVGYWGIVDYHLHSPAGWQVFTDLVVACVLLLTWIVPEAKREGRNPWPFVVITLLAGSIGPLLYLMTRK